MLHKILIVLKVLFRNGETVIDIIQQMYAEFNENSEDKKELDDMSKQVLSGEEV